MKTRIITDGKRFYPQRKGFFGWSNYTEEGVCIDGMVITEVVSFGTLDEALEFFKPTEWRIVWPTT